MKLLCFFTLFCICTIASAQLLVQPDASTKVPAYSVFVLGQVRVPAVIAYEPELTLYKAIVRLGGTVDFSATPVQLIRDGTIIKKTTRLSKGSPDDVPLKPKDVVYAGVIHVTAR